MAPSSVYSEEAAVLKDLMATLAACAVALTFVTSFVPSVGKPTYIESFTLGCLLFPGPPDLPVVSISSALSVLVFLVTIFGADPSSPAVDINYVTGLLNMVSMFVLVAWASLAAKTERISWIRLACPVAACFVVAAGDVAPTKGPWLLGSESGAALQATVFVFARCYRYVFESRGYRATTSTLVSVIGSVVPIAVAIWPTVEQRLVGFLLLLLSLAHYGIFRVTRWLRHGNAIHDATSSGSDDE